MPETVNRPGVLSESGLLPVITGTSGPVTLAEIKRRRAIAAALASRSRPFPTTIGQGLTSLGEAFGDVMAEKRLTAQEAELRKRSLAELNPTAGAVPAVAASTAAPIVPPVAARPPAAPVAPVAPVVAQPPAADPREAIARAIQAREGIVGPSEPQPAREVASPDPTLAGEQPPQVSPTATASEPPLPTAGGDDPVWAARQSAIEGIESRGQPDPYQAVGAPTKYGRGLGRYQVVEANIAPWTQAALGQALTPQQYLASPQAQDAVFKHRFGQYVDQFGEEGAARAWFGGPGNVNKGDLTDVHKRLSIADYGKTYMEGLQASADPTQLAYASTGTATDAPSPAARGGMAIPPLAEENPVTPSDITPAPTRVAEARGVVPGAASSMPPSRDAAPAGYEMPEPKPPEPIRQVPPKDIELRATRALMIDPENQAAAYMLQQAQVQRKFEQDREVERYKSEMATFHPLYTKWVDWQRDRKKRGLEEAKLEQEVQAGKLQKVGENDRVLQFDKDGVLKDITPDAPGTVPGGKPSVKLNEAQSKTFGNLQTADIAHEQYRRIPDADKVLATGLQDELAGRLPFVGNAAMSARYRRARNAALQLADAQLREVSGASIGVAEEAKAIARLFPVYGDDAGTLRQKAEVRDGIVTGMKLKLGKNGVLADWAAAERAKVDTDKQVKIEAEMKDVPKVVGKIYKDGSKRRYWTGSRWEDD